MDLPRCSWLAIDALGLAPRPTLAPWLQPTPSLPACLAPSAEALRGQLARGATSGPTRQTYAFTEFVGDGRAVKFTTQSVSWTLDRGDHVVSLYATRSGLVGLEVSRDRRAKVGLRLGGLVRAAWRVAEAPEPLRAAAWSRARLGLSPCPLSAEVLEALAQDLLPGPRPFAPVAGLAGPAGAESWGLGLRVMPGGSGNKGLWDRSASVSGYHLVDPAGARRELRVSGKVGVVRGGRAGRVGLTTRWTWA